MMTLNSQVRRWVALCSVVMLAACGSSKPPGCADPTTVATAKQLIVDTTVKYLGDHVADDPDGWVRKFSEALKVEISGIVGEGYNSEKKRQSCKGTLRITSPTGPMAERAIEYSTQRTEDRKDGFLFEVQDITPFIAVVSKNLREYYNANRWAGTWNGTYSCGGIDGASDGPQGPYNMPVSMQVTGSTAKLERKTRGGGVETLEGEFGTIAPMPPLSLRGSGQNTPDDQWQASFIGKVQGKKVLAQGVISSQGKDLRKCQLDLELGGPSLAPVSVASANAAGGTVPAGQAAVAPGQPAAPTGTSRTAEQDGTARVAGSLCKPPETVLFSCGIGRKTLSVCQDSDLASASLSLSYRYGIAGEPPEMVYPEAGRLARDAFKYGVQSYPGGGGQFLSFDVRDFRYVVFAAQGKGWEKQGVVTDRADKRLGSGACTSKIIVNMDPRMLAAAGLVEDARTVQLP